MAQISIVVDGMTGSGKTTLVDALAKELSLELMPEEFRDPYNLLEKFSYDEKWCYPMQLNFLMTRYIQYKVASETETGHYILDRSIYSDPIYANLYYQMNHLSEQEFQDYQLLYRKLVSSLETPRCMIVLNCSFEQIMKRIESRGRSDELQLGREEYWWPLYQAYQEHVEKIKSNKDQYDHLLFIDTEEMDLLQSKNVTKIIKSVSKMIGPESLSFSKEAKAT